jgi:hypothetical protein
MKISRRTVLRGAGATLALPWLESWPALGRTPYAFPKRFAVLFMGNGIHGNHWWARETGAEMALSRSLAPLEPLKRKTIVINGLFNRPSVGNGIHPAQTGNLLSGVPLQKGPVAKSGVTVDQLIARHVGRDTRHPSLVLACEPQISGLDDETRFSLTYSSHISWHSTGSPVHSEIDPSRAFDTLFAARAPFRSHSIIDRVHSAAKRLARRISSTDNAAVDRYLTSVREVERRIDAISEDLRDRARLMCDVIALAFQTDTTRVASLVLARDLSSLSYPFLDVRVDHHSASHDDLSDGYERIVRFHVSQLAYLASTLDAIPEGDGTVLDHSCILWLSNMWSGWKHDNMKLPVVIVGGLGGTIQTGRSLECLYAGDENRKVCSLYLSILNKMGVQADRFGDADKMLARI